VTIAASAASVPTPGDVASVPLARSACLALAISVALAACVDTRRASPKAALDATPVAEVAPVAAQPPGPTIGSGSVKVALLLPLSGGGGGGAAATSLRNAADLALAEFQNPDLTILVKDDRGTADGAREAATAALGEGAELIIGPLFAPAVIAAGGVAKAAGKPVLAFSTDVNAASPGVYLLSFMAQSEVDRVVDYAVAQGRRSFAALIPDTTYGSVVEAQFREAVARANARVAAIERYTPGQPQPAVQRLASVLGGPAPQVDALLIPDASEALPAIGSALISAGFDPARVKPLGTGVWNNPRAFGIAALQGGWFAAPDAAGFASFANRYRARFGGEPTRIATLGYDAVSLAAALARTGGNARFSDGALTNPSGFNGIDGVFRFRPDGSNVRALSVLEVRNGATNVVSAAPRTFAASGT
jgi:hypothetical protein